MIDKLFHLGKEITLDKGKLPKHIAIIIGGNQLWAEDHKEEVSQAYAKSFSHLLKILEMTIELNIPILTIHLLSEKMRESPRFIAFMDQLVPFLAALPDSPLVKNNQVKISVFGKWYKLPDRLVDAIKETISKTRVSDRFFLNLCINYDGQDEIVDACKLIGKHVSMGRLDPDLVSRETIKENLYTSSFLPVSLMIITGPTKSTNGFLLWDSKYAQNYYAKKQWLDFTRGDFLEALGFHQKE
ncbi:MAG: polyprenyl diphosphate synthase [Nanoarchaeota archaeon]